MNIFRLDNNPTLAAQYLCNKHIVKMALETCQILHTNLTYIGIKEPWLYKMFNPKHPSVMWARQSQKNYLWTIQHGLAICDEYTFRYKKQHTCKDLINKTLSYVHLFPDIPETPLLLAMPKQYHTNDPVHSYRLYYVHEKRKFAKWEPFRSSPPWWEEYINQYVHTK